MCNYGENNFLMSYVTVITLIARFNYILNNIDHIICNIYCRFILNPTSNCLHYEFLLFKTFVYLHLYHKSKVTVLIHNALSDTKWMFFYSCWFLFIGQLVLSSCAATRYLVKHKLNSNSYFKQLTAEKIKCHEHYSIFHLSQCP